MNPQNKDKITFIIALILGTIILAGIILAVDFLYAGIQERFFENISPSYEPNIELANRVIIASSISIIAGFIIYVAIVWFITRSEKIKLQLEDERVLDQEGSINFRLFQYEISSSIKVLRDLFAYLVIIVLISGLFSFLRFIWIFSKYRSYNQLFIEYYLSNFTSMGISITLYIALGFMINYIVITSLQKYARLKHISKSYDTAMEKVLDNFDRLMKEEQ